MSFFRSIEIKFYFDIKDYGFVRGKPLLSGLCEGEEKSMRHALALQKGDLVQRKGFLDGNGGKDYSGGEI